MATREVVRCEQTGSAPGDYRWLLEVDLIGSEGPGLVVIQLNPSTANDTASDPTVGKVEAWARRNGFGSVSFTNLFAMRTPDPRSLVSLAGADFAAAVGAANDRWLAHATESAGCVVAAWGAPVPSLRQWVAERAMVVVELVGREHLFTVGSLTSAGWPRHGRMWNGSPVLTRWGSAKPL